MKPSARVVAIGVAVIVLLPGVAALLQRPLQRLAQPSVVREVAVFNAGRKDLTVVVVMPDSKKVVARVAVAARGPVVLRVFAGDSSSTYARTGFVFVAWADDGTSHSLVLNGQEIEDRGDRIEFRDGDVR